MTSQVFSLPQPSRRTEQSQKRARDGSVIVGSLAVGSTDEVSPGQGVAGQVNVSEGAQVLPGQEVAGQETALEGAVQIPGEETDQNEGEGGSNELRGDGAKTLDVRPVKDVPQQLLVKGLLNRIYWKVAVGKLPVGHKDYQKGSNKMDRNLVSSMSSEGASEQDLNLALEDDTDQRMDDGALVVMAYDPGTLIQSATTMWVMRRGLADRALWSAIATAAQRICAEMVQVDELNAQLNTGRLLFERRDQGHYGDLHHSFHEDPCLPVVGNYPLSVMGALLSPGLEKEFRNTEKFGTAMEAIAYDWSRSPGMEVHVELMARVANLVAPFLRLGGQGTVVNSEFLWQHGRDQMMEFLQAATCADQLEVLWRRMDDDADEEVDPTGMVLEIPDQQDAVLDQGNNPLKMLEVRHLVTLEGMAKRQKSLRKRRHPVGRQDWRAQGFSCGQCTLALLPISLRRTALLGRSLTAQKGILVKDQTMVTILPLRGTYPGSLKTTSTKWCQKRWKGLQIWMGWMGLFREVRDRWKR